ncbi:MAG TPA: PilN domain-containing protein [Gemmatimonadaceae bacterium]|jgi:Tfp pilus assembly protein PilN|nr:PilN domain-containing protein [Gemmatimonadaceae bacterium]
MIEINLLPGARKKTKRSGGPGFDASALLASLSARVKDRWLAAAVVAGVVSVLAMGTMFLLQSRRETRVTDAEQKALQDSTRYAAVLKERVHLEAKRDTLLRQLNIIKAIDGDRFVWPHILDEVSRALPAYTWLTAVTFSGTPQGQTVGAHPAEGDAEKAKAKKGAKLDTSVPLDTVRIKILGRTVDIQALTRFMTDLEASPFLADVTLDRSTMALESGVQVTDFQLNAVYTRPDSSVIRRVPLSVSVK